MGLGSFIQRILPEESKAAGDIILNRGTSVRGDLLSLPPQRADFREIGGVTLYGSDSGANNIEKGYNSNDSIFTIVSRAASKFGSIPFRHVVLRRDGRKAFEEYTQASREGVHLGNLLELKRMKKAAFEDERSSSGLSKWLNKPNRYQSGAQFREQMYGYKLLQGEANHWLIRPLDGSGVPGTKGKILEALLIPRQFLGLIKGGDPWQPYGYIFQIEGAEKEISRKNLLLWNTPGYTFDPATLQHLRGFSPLDAGIKLLQAANSATERMVAVNSHAGASGLLFRKDSQKFPDPVEAEYIRNKVLKTVNGPDNAHKIATMAGEWDYLQFGLSAQEMQLVEQYALNFSRLCNLFNVPPGIFADEPKYANVVGFERKFIFNHIAPAAYAYRDALNASDIVESFGLDPATNFVEADLMALPEMAADFKELSDSVLKFWPFTPDMMLEAVGYEPTGLPEMQKRYAPGGLKPLEMLGEPGAGDLNEEMSDLGED